MVLPIGGFFMSATHLHHYDKKLRVQAGRVFMSRPSLTPSHKKFISFGQDVLGDKLSQKD